MCTWSVYPNTVTTCTVSVVVILIQLLVGNQIEHCIDRTADTITAIVGILTIKNKRISIRRTKTIKISKNSLFP